MNLLNRLSAVILPLSIFLFGVTNHSHARVGVVADSISVDTRCANNRMGRGKCPQGHEYVPPVGATFGAQSSTFAADNDFDFVETFDGLQNWVRYEGRVGNTDNVANMPKLIDGSDSAWGYYSMWGDQHNPVTPPNNWIGDYGDHRVWRGTKAATIDIGETAKGPSRLGFHMGEGYSEFHLFYMVRIPKNQFPTECVGGSCSGGNPEGSYIEGNDYAYWAAWKFNTFNMDCPSAMCPDSNTYSDKWGLLASVRQYNYGDAPGVTMHMIDSDHLSDDWLRGPVNLNAMLGDWFGIEWKVSQFDDRAELTYWIYDQQGNATLMVDKVVKPTPDGFVAGKWNQFFFGGNNSNSYEWGPTMDSSYQIDDVIVDDQRIGPKYFAAIEAGPPQSNPHQATSPVTLPASWFAYGDSQTGGRASETNAESPMVAFERIYIDSGYGTPTSDFSGLSGNTLGNMQDTYNGDVPHTNPAWLHFQDSGSQKGATDTQTLFGDTLDTFVNTAFAELTDSATVISTETAFSFGREAEAGRNWDGYNDELRTRLTAQHLVGNTVYIAETDAHIKSLQNQVTPAEVWFQVGESNAYHYKGLGNLMIALAMFESLGYDVDTLNLSGIPEGGTITNARKQICLDIIKGRI